MNQPDNNEDILMKQLMAKSLQKIPSINFTDIIMQRIEAETELEESPSRSIKYSWIAIIAALFLGIIFINLFVPSTTNTYSLIGKFFAQYKDVIQLTIICAIATIILLIVDNLLTVSKKYYQFKLFA